MANAHAAFAGGGRCDVDLLPTEAIDRRAIHRADALIVRSRTRIDRALVAGTRLRFVGSCTVGEDHVDRDALAGAGIRFAGAPGSSATSVAQFTLAMLVLVMDRLGRAWTRARLAVVGAGAIGERVAACAERLGLAVTRIDPPLRETTGDTARYADPDALAEVDAVTLHVPLTASGPHATRHLVEAAFLDRLPPGAVLLNTSRGAVVDEPALLRSLATGHLAGAGLDVFVGEPTPDPAVIRAATLATPHVAGRSRDGLLANTLAVHRAFTTFFDLPSHEDDPIWHPPPEPWPPGPAANLVDALETAWRLTALDAGLRESCEGDAPSRARAFLDLRARGSRRRDLTGLSPRAPECAELTRLLAAMPRGA